MSARKPFRSDSITLRYWDGPRPCWRGTLHFWETRSGDHPAELDDVSAEGELRTRSYHTPGDDDRAALTEITDLLLRSAAHLGIEFDDPFLVAERDDDDPRPMPEDWPELIEEQASRLGWRVPDHYRSGR